MRSHCSGKRNAYLTLLLIVGLSAATVLVQAKKFMRCELSRQLVEKYHIQKSYLSNWVCLIEHESGFDTREVRRNADGSSSYGLFQLSSNQACGAQRPQGICQRKCEDFADDNIDDDVACAKRILDQEGFKYWRGWNQSCSSNTINSLPNLRVLCNSDQFSYNHPVIRRSYGRLYMPYRQNH